MTDSTTQQLSFHNRITALLSLQDLDNRLRPAVKELGVMLQDPVWPTPFHSVGGVLRGGNDQAALDVMQLSLALKTLTPTQLKQLLTFLP